MRERVCVLLAEKPGENTQRLIIGARVSNLHFSLRGVSLVTSEGLSCVEVTLENDDMDPKELSRLAILHLGLVDEKDAFHRFKISKLHSSFFLVEGREVGAPLVGRVCPCFSSLPMGHTWSLFFCQKAIEEAMLATPSLGEAGVLQDTRSCVIPRPFDENNDTESSRHASNKLFYVYVDNLGVLGKVTCEY